MPKLTQRRADREQFWRDAISAWKASGQTVRAFCADRGVSEARFFARRKQLAGDARPGRRAPTVPAPSFVAVRVVPEPTAEVFLPNGLVVRVPLGADHAAVARLVAALGGRPC